MFKKYDKNIRHGFTLIELLLVMLMGSLIMSLLVETYLAYIHSHQLQKNILALQNNAQKVIYTLHTEIHKAGYLGCARLRPDFPITNYLQHKINLNSGLSGDSHTLTLYYLAEENNMLLTVTHPQTILVSQSKLKIGDKAIIADCKHAEMLTVKAIEKTAAGWVVNPKHSLQFPFNQGALIGQFIKQIFFIAKTKRKNKCGELISALFMKDGNRESKEIAENVEKILFEYSVANKQGEFSAKEIDNWASVVGVRVTFTLSLMQLHKVFYTYIALLP